MKDLIKKARQVTNKVVGGAEEAIDKTKKFIDGKAEPIKIEWEIAKKKASLDALLLGYGKAYYYENVSEEEKEKLRSAMIEVEVEIDQLKAQLEDIKAAEIKVTEEKAEEKATVYCTNCGKAYKEKEKYCSKCGNKL